MNIRYGIVLLLFFLLPHPAPAAEHEWFADDPPLLFFSAGAAEILDEQEFYWNLEYRPSVRFYHVGPWMSIGAGKEDEFYGAVGVLINLELGHGWVFTPTFGGGYYKDSSGLDLGYDTEFRSGIEIAKRFSNGHRLGLAFTHLSNGSLGDVNPGTETLGVSYAIPLDFLFHNPFAGD